VGPPGGGGARPVPGSVDDVCEDDGATRSDQLEDDGQSSKHAENVMESSIHFSAMLLRKRGCAFEVLKRTGSVLTSRMRVFAVFYGLVCGDHILSWRSIFEVWYPGARVPHRPPINRCTHFEIAWHPMCLPKCCFELCMQMKTALSCLVSS
jgi:hypothetical protein